MGKFKDKCKPPVGRYYSDHKEAVLLAWENRGKALLAKEKMTEVWSAKLCMFLCLLSTATMMVLRIVILFLRAGYPLKSHHPFKL